MKIPSKKLSNGSEMPMIGLGTWQSPAGQVYKAVRAAIDVGYRHFDLAYNYQNESEVGQAIRDAITDGQVTREELFLTSKIWLTFLRPDRVPIGLSRSLADLGTDYLDLYLIHWPMAFKQVDDDRYPKVEGDSDRVAFDETIDYVDTWRAMEGLVESGKVKSIGISNFNKSQLTRLLESCKIVPQVHQIESHPHLPQTEMINYCKEKSIAVTAYCPLGSTPRDSRIDPPILMEDPFLLNLARKYGKSTAQILIRFHIDRGVAAIPKSVTPHRIATNLDIFDFSLDEEDVKELESFKRRYRFCPFDNNGIDEHIHYPFKGPDANPV